MKTLTVTLASICGDAAPMLEKIIADAPENTEILLENGEYPLSRAIEMQGKKGIVIDGQGATLSPFFDRERGAENSAEVVHMLGCSDVTFRNFTVSSPVAVNSAGKMVNVTNDYVDVEMYASTPLNGQEQFIAGMTFDEEWIPTSSHWVASENDPAKRTIIAGEIPCTAPAKPNTPHELIGDQLIRVYTKNARWCKEGTFCNISHTYYGLVAFTHRQSHRITYENINMANFGGFGFLILPYCSDFTFRRVNFRPIDRAHQPFALNSDGIHTTGLGGSLLIEDCEFDCIGDDHLNVHTQVMTVTEIDGNRIKLVYDKIGGIVSPYWSEAGDLLRVYDPKTLVFRGKVKVASSDRGDITLESNDVQIRMGDFVTADKYYPDVTIRRCSFERFRGRALCLQGSDNLLLEDCVFHDCVSNAVYLSSAFEYWLEAGPLANVTVRNNLFLGSGRWRRKGDYGHGIIWQRINSKNSLDVVPPHKNLLIENNRFENIAGPAAVVQLTDGVTVRGNVIDGTTYDAEHFRFDRCTNVNLGENTVIPTKNNDE